MQNRQKFNWALLLVVSMILALSVSCQKQTVAVEKEMESTAPEDSTELSTAGSYTSEEDTLDASTAAGNEESEIVMRANVFFEFDKATLTPEAQEALIINGQWLRTNADVAVTIEGHCDERGTNGYNLALGDRRAETVKTFLIDLGVDRSRLTTLSYGEERPLDRGQGEAAWAKNRRAHFLIQ